MLRKGFTLIELVIVVGLVALLAVIVVLLLNPAEILRQSRDTGRLSDASVLGNAIQLYLVSVSNPSIGAAGTCYTSNATTTARCGNLFSAAYGSVIATTSHKVDGTGWLPVNLTDIPSGAPVGTLPVDPVNDDTYYYAYASSPTSSVYEINMNMESEKYKSGGPKDVESTDKGDNDGWYETGNASGFAL